MWQENNKHHHTNNNWEYYSAFTNTIVHFWTCKWVNSRYVLMLMLKKYRSLSLRMIYKTTDHKATDHKAIPKLIG